MIIKYLRNLRENICLQAVFWLDLFAFIAAIYCILAACFDWNPPSLLFNEKISLSNFVIMVPLLTPHLSFLSLLEFLIRKFFMKQRTIEEPKNIRVKTLDKIYTVIFSIVSFINFLLFLFLSRMVFS